MEPSGRNRWRPVANGAVGMELSSLELGFERPLVTNEAINVGPSVPGGQLRRTDDTNDAPLGDQLGT
jgi:hypothetical protein